HPHLSNCLPLIILKKATGSLAIQDKFNERDYQEFLSMSKNIEKSAGAGSEPFPDIFLNLKKVNINLMKEVIILLAKYYHNAYDKDFILLSKIYLSDTMLILLKINVFKGHTKSAKILAQFTHEDTKDTYANIVQYYFKYTVYFLKPEGSKKYSLVFVR
ncbi:11629_t:CDS:2, partial [Funneliformis mosseae]